MSEIIINGLKFFAYHGVNPEEKENGQYFLIDLICKTELTRCFMSDSLDETVSYSAIIKAVKRIFCSCKDNLIERAAFRIIEGLMEEFADISQIDITLKKPDAPIKASFSYVGVHLCYNRNEIFPEKAFAPVEPEIIPLADCPSNNNPIPNTPDLNTSETDSTHSSHPFSAPNYPPTEERKPISKIFTFDFGDDLK